MDIVELSHVVSLSLSHKTYLQELNAQNVSLADVGQTAILDSSFEELLAGVDVTNTSMHAWRDMLEAKTVMQPVASSLDELSMAASKQSGKYGGLAEGYSRLLDLYRAGLGRR